MNIEEIYLNDYTHLCIQTCNYIISFEFERVRFSQRKDFKFLIFPFFKYNNSRARINISPHFYK